MKRSFAIVSVLALLFVAPAARADWMDDFVADAQATVVDFEHDPQMEWFRENVSHAKGMLIVPQLVRAAFLFGGAGGSGVFLARDRQTGSWSYPAFYSMGAASVGPHFGGEAAQVIFLMMTDRAVDSMLATTFQLGADVEVAAGPVGRGAKTATADILAFSRGKGFYGGATVDGAVIATRDSWNAEYYGRPIRPMEILIDRAVVRPRADGLRDAVARVTGSVPVARLSETQLPGTPW